MKSARSPFVKFFGGARLPVVLQTEAGECGLACLVMLSIFWGHRIDLASLRRRFSISVKGVTLRNLMAMAKGLGLQPRPIKAGLEDLRRVRLPCILHWDLTHYVVLKAVSARTATIHDPAVGERRMAWEQVSDHFTGVALELTPGTDFRPMDETQRFTWLSLIGRVVGLRRGLMQLLLLGICLQVCALAMPFYLQWIVDEALVSSDRDLVTVLGIGFLLLVVAQSAIGAVRSWVTTVMATDLNFQWLGNAFAHLMKLPIAYFEKRHLGDIVSRFGSIQTIQRSLTSQFVEGVIDGLLVIGTFVVMSLYSLQLAALPLAVLAIYGLVRWSIFRSLREATGEQIIHAAKQHTHFLESARGIQSVRLFNRAEERRVGWMNALADQFNAELRVARLSISHQTANTLLFSAERVVVVWLSALAVLDAQFSVGMVFAFLSYKEQFSQRTASLIDKVVEWRMLRLHGERVADILLTMPERAEEPGDSGAAPEDLAIELRRLSFRYADGEPYIVKDLDLVIPSGQCLAITGASGSGKTTLVKLLLGLLDPSSGEILVGGVRIDRLGLSKYRQLVGTVMQDDTLFAGTIAENIAFFDPSPSQDRIEQCARLAAIHDEIMPMPMGYNTIVGDIGIGLSGGQKQRIVLARALYKNPRLLVLDEATSHLDIANEQLVNSAIQQIAMTRIIVAHRPETIASAQRVIVIEEGRVASDRLQPGAHREPPARVATDARAA